MRGGLLLSGSGNSGPGHRQKALCCAGGASLAAGLPGTYFVVASGSMSGTIEVNDVIIVKLNDAYQEDDIVTFKNNGSFITHRVERIEKDKVKLRILLADLSNQINASVMGICDETGRGIVGTDMDLSEQKGIRQAIKTKKDNIYFLENGPQGERECISFAVPIKNDESGKLYIFYATMARELLTNILPPGLTSLSNLSREGKFITMAQVASPDITGEPTGLSDTVTAQLAVPPRISGPYEGNQETSLPSNIPA